MSLVFLLAMLEMPYEKTSIQVDLPQKYSTLPETNIAPENRWLEY